MEGCVDVCECVDVGSQERAPAAQWRRPPAIGGASGVPTAAGGAVVGGGGGDIACENRARR